MYVGNVCSTVKKFKKTTKLGVDMEMEEARWKMLNKFCQNFETEIRYLDPGMLIYFQ